jgi:DNA-binding Lrp family transcriptional regulator
MLTAFDKALLNVLQTGLPISKHPFADLAEKLDSDESIVLHRLQALKRDGYIRRIGPFFDSYKLGYAGSLIALKVTDGYMESVAVAINQYPGATHNYEREGRYNLWFTLLTPPESGLREQILTEIRALPGVVAMIDLVSKKKYKINVQFKLK